MSSGRVRAALLSLLLVVSSAAPVASAVPPDPPVTVDCFTFDALMYETSSTNAAGLGSTPYSPRIVAARIPASLADAVALGGSGLAVKNRNWFWQGDLIVAGEDLAGTYQLLWNNENRIPVPPNPPGVSQHLRWTFQQAARVYIAWDKRFTKDGTYVGIEYVDWGSRLSWFDLGNDVGTSNVQGWTRIGGSSLNPAADFIRTQPSTATPTAGDDNAGQGGLWARNVAAGESLEFFSTVMLTGPEALPGFSPYVVFVRCLDPCAPTVTCALGSDLRSADLTITRPGAGTTCDCGTIRVMRAVGEASEEEVFLGAPPATGPLNLPLPADCAAGTEVRFDVTCVSAGVDSDPPASCTIACPELSTCAVTLTCTPNGDDTVRVVGLRQTVVPDCRCSEMVLLEDGAEVYRGPADIDASYSLPPGCRSGTPVTFTLRCAGLSGDGSTATCTVYCAGLPACDPTLDCTLSSDKQHISIAASAPETLACEVATMRLSVGGTVLYSGLYSGPPLIPPELAEIPLPVCVPGEDLAFELVVTGPRGDSKTATDTVACPELSSCDTVLSATPIAGTRRVRVVGDASGGALGCNCDDLSLTMDGTTVPHDPGPIDMEVELPGGCPVGSSVTFRLACTGPLGLGREASATVVCPDLSSCDVSLQCDLNPDGTSVRVRGGKAAGSTTCNCDELSLTMGGAPAGTFSGSFDQNVSLPPGCPANSTVTFGLSCSGPQGPGTVATEDVVCPDLSSCDVTLQCVVNPDGATVHVRGERQTGVPECRCTELVLFREGTLIGHGPSPLEDDYDLPAGCPAGTQVTFQIACMGPLGPGVAASSTVDCPRSEPRFVRGQCNGDSRVDIADSIFWLNHQFFGQQAPQCLLACDSNDDNKADISDAIYTLTFLFLATGVPPPPPYPVCDVDPTPPPLGVAPLGCATQPVCR